MIHTWDDTVLVPFKSTSTGRSARIFREYINASIEETFKPNFASVHASLIRFTQCCGIPNTAAYSSCWPYEAMQSLSMRSLLASIWIRFSFLHWTWMTRSSLLRLL